MNEFNIQIIDVITIIIIITDTNAAYLACLKVMIDISITLGLP